MTRTARVIHISRRDGRVYLSTGEEFTTIIDKLSAKKLFPFAAVGDYVEMTLDEYGRIISSNVMVYEEPTTPLLEHERCTSP